MDDKPPKTPAGELIRSLGVKPFCDSSDVNELSPEEIAALHMFKHELLAAYWRLRMVVSEVTADRIISKRLREIFDDPKKK